GEGDRGSGGTVPDRELPVEDGGGGSMIGRWALLAGTLLGAVPAAAQEPMGIGRLHYEGGGDWYANPSSLPNLLKAIGERTPFRMTNREKGVRPVDDDLWQLPFLHMTGHGNVKWSEADLVILRRSLEQGGFLDIDDNYGMDESI